jgi:hypothetical protein
MRSKNQCVPGCDPGDCNDCYGGPTYGFGILDEGACIEVAKNIRIPNGCTLFFDLEKMKEYREKYDDPTK